MGSTVNIGKDNIIPTTEEHLLEDVRQLLEECKKKRDEEDRKAALASIKVDRCGKVTKMKEIDFTSTSTDAPEVTPPVSATFTGVTMEQVKNLFAERDVRLVDLITEKMMILASKQPVIDDTSPISTVESTEIRIPQSSAILPTSQPPYGMPMNYFSGQIVMPTNALVAQQTYSDPLTSIQGLANFRRTYELENSTPPYYTHTYNMPSVPPETPCHISVLSRMRCLTDTCSDGNIGSNRSNQPHQPVRPVHLNRSDWSYRPVRPVLPLMQHQTSRLHLLLHSQIL